MLDECLCIVYNDIRSSNGLSPNGKATDSDSVIFKVRILVAQLKAFQVSWEAFFVLPEGFYHVIYAGKVEKP